MKKIFHKYAKSLFSITEKLDQFSVQKLDQLTTKF